MAKSSLIKAIDDNREIIGGILFLITTLFVSVQVAETPFWRIGLVGVLLLLIDLKTFSKISESIGGLISFLIVFVIFPIPANILMGLALAYVVSRPFGPVPLGTIFLAIIYTIGKFFV
jgi:hypothetical protein